MERVYYREQALETIARRVVCAFDACLYYGPVSYTHLTLPTIA